MFVRLWRIFLLQFWLAWVFLILPAHTRGAISIAGSGTASTGPQTAMMFDSLPVCCRAKNDKSPAKSADNCAICQIMSHSTNPPTLPAFDHKFELLPWALDLPMPPGREQLFLRTTRSRAPPIA